MAGAGGALAETDIAKITDVTVKRDNSGQQGIYHFLVTIEHHDQGWEDYVEAWEILGPDDQILGVRPIFQPSPEKAVRKTALAGVVVPAEVNEVTIRARTYPNGYESEPVQVSIPR